MLHEGILLRKHSATLGAERRARARFRCRQVLTNASRIMLQASVPETVSAGCAQLSSRHSTVSGVRVGNDCSIRATIPVVTAAACDVPDIVNSDSVLVIDPGSSRRPETRSPRSPAAEMANMNAAIAELGSVWLPGPLLPCGPDGGGARSQPRYEEAELITRLPLETQYRDRCATSI